jgi:hypothetical protein
MPTVIIEITQIEQKALQTICASPQEWADNAVKNRARIAIDEIVQICVAKCLEQSIQIPQSKEEIVDLAITNGWVNIIA